MIIGITGSFGSGKTTVANMFSRHGFKIINADKLYHQDFYKNYPLRNKIEKEFGTLSRSKLKKIVFSDYSKLRKLNRITHPVIIKMMKKEIQKLIKNANKKANYKIPKVKKYNNKNKSLGKIKNGDYNKKKIIDANIVVDIPLLFEAKVEKLFDSIIGVKCDKKMQINSILKKKKYTKKEIEQVIKSQMPLKEKIKRADFVVDNGKSLRETQRDVKELADRIMCCGNIKEHF